MNPEVHAITLDLNDDEYGAVTAEAVRLGVDPRGAIMVYIKGLTTRDQRSRKLKTIIDNWFAKATLEEQEERMAKAGFAL